MPLKHVKPNAKTYLRIKWTVDEKLLHVLALLILQLKDSKISDTPQTGANFLEKSQKKNLKLFLANE